MAKLSMALSVKYYIFTCYDPINLQSMCVDFQRDTNEDNLYNCFDIIGDMAWFDRIVYTISIIYSGYVSSLCGCLNQNSNKRLVYDHALKHHETLLNLIDKQLDKISQLTKLDALLYEVAKNVFAL